MTFHVIDKRTGKEPIFDGNHIFRESWCKGRLIEHDIDGWYISEDGQLALVDDCCNMAYPPPDRFKIVYDEPTVCDIEDIKQEIRFIAEKCLPSSIAEEYEVKGLQTALDIIDKHISGKE